MVAVRTSIRLRGFSEIAIKRNSTVVKQQGQYMTQHGQSFALGVCQTI
jgi:hypothetical protein